MELGKVVIIGPGGYGKHVAAEIAVLGIDTNLLHIMEDESLKKQTLKDEMEARKLVIEDIKTERHPESYLSGREQRRLRRKQERLNKKK